jgi:hypothetical protein
MAAETRARIVVQGDGVIHAYVSPEVMYDLDASKGVIEDIMQVFHPRCCSGLTIAFKSAQQEFDLT